MEIAGRLIDAVQGRVAETGLGEARAEYDETVVTAAKKRRPRSYAEDIATVIRKAFPNADVEIYRRAPREFTIEVFDDEIDSSDVHEVLGYMQSDTLVFHDVWVVVLTQRRTLED